MKPGDLGDGPRRSSRSRRMVLQERIEFALFWHECRVTC